MKNKMTHFLESQRRQANWTAFLTPLLHEMSSMLNEEEFRQLMAAAGSGAGQAHALAQCESIDELESQINLHLEKLGWGVVSFAELEDRLEIRHECPPQEAPGDNHFADFLQGLYQQWFRAAGAGDNLEVQRALDASEGVLIYHLAG